MKKRLFTIAILTASVLSLNVSCSDDFVEREFNQSVQESPLTSLDEIQAFVRGAYASMRSSSYYGCDFLAYGEIRSDEMYSTKGSGYYTTIQDYSMLSTDGYASGTWNQIYTMIAKTNVAINSDVASFKGTQNELRSAYFVQGQAYALRALGFFDLLRLYGQKYTGAPDQLGVVLPTSYDPLAKMPRATIAETEAQIEKDFAKAIELMTANNAYSTVDGKTDISLTAVKALMSRYYLAKGDYAKVRSLVGEIANSFNPVASGLLAESFKFTMNGAAPNSIFELAVGTNSSLSTSSYRHKLHPNGYANLAVNPSVLSLYTAGDVRRALIQTVTSTGIHYITGKYTNTVGADNIKVVRIEEVLLNGVEAELNGGSPAKALEYYNKIVTNRGLTAATTVTMEMLKRERTKELLGEGFRQWDLLRWGDTSYVPAGKNKNLLAFPIPRAEINIEGTLIKPNPGYEN